MEDYYNGVKKKKLPQLFEIAQKLGCYLLREGKEEITKEYIDSL
jgi:hypothetical protein